jgi:DNA-binding NtrC family response regulator
MNRRTDAAAAPAALVATTVLVVDPDSAARREIAAWLRDAGYAPQEAATFEEARRALATARPHALVAGLRLGAFNGLHLVITARAAHPTLRAVVVTAAEDAAVARQAQQAGAGYLIKPLHRGALLDAIGGRRRQ